jgi:cell division protein FtsA
MKDYTLAAIDVGSSKICTLVAEATQDNGLRILGVGVTPSRGVKKGMVDNIQEATEAIDASVDRAEKSSGAHIAAAHISIGGTHATSTNNRGVSTIPGQTRPITEDDIDRALEAPATSAFHPIARSSTASPASSSWTARNRSPTPSGCSASASTWTATSSQDRSQRFRT